MQPFSGIFVQVYYLFGTKAVSLEKQNTGKSMDKFSKLFLQQMESTVFIILQIFSGAHAENIRKKWKDICHIKISNWHKKSHDFGKYS